MFNHRNSLSRLLLCGLVLLYAIPGLLARSPWKPEDAIGFGLGQRFAELPFLNWSHWAYLAIGDRLYAGAGPLPSWMAGLLGKLAAALYLPTHWQDDLMRLGNIAWLGLAAWALWYGTFKLVSRSQVLHPNNPTLQTTDPRSHAHAVADAAVLCLLSTLGLLMRSHFQVPDLCNLAGLSLITLAAIQALDRPQGAGWVLGVGISICLLSQGFAHALVLCTVLLLSSAMHPNLRFGLGGRLLRAGGVCVVLCCAWFIWLQQSAEGQMWWQAWWQHNLHQFSALNPAPLAGLKLLSTGAKTTAWFYWPTLPLALWGLWAWRKHWLEPALRIPCMAALAGLLALLITNPSNESNYLPLLLPLAMLAAFGLITLQRTLVSLVDWFAVLWFTFAAVLVWLGWTAATLGWPQKIAANFEKLSPGYQAEIIGWELALAILASLAWLRLIVWRTRSEFKALWRPMILSCGGLVLIWLLTMTLWIPRIDYAKRFTPVAEQIAKRIQNQSSTNPKGLAAHTCIVDYNLGFAQRAALQHHGQLQFVRAAAAQAQCPYLLLQDDQRLQLASLAAFQEQTGWDLLWSGRRNADRHELFFLFQRKPAM